MRSNRILRLTFVLLRQTNTKSKKRRRSGAGKTEIDGEGEPKGDEAGKMKPQMNAKDHICLKSRLKTLTSHPF